MTIKDFINQVENLKELLLTEVNFELHDLARERAYYCLDSVIEILKDNEEDERG